MQGTTDNNGVLRIPVRADPATMILTVAGTKITLQGGALKRIREGHDGVKQRLSNMGFGEGHWTSWDGGTYRDALLDFQRLHGLSDSGQFDVETHAKLKKFYV